MSVATPAGGPAGSQSSSSSPTQSSPSAPSNLATAVGAGGKAELPRRSNSFSEMSVGSGVSAAAAVVGDSGLGGDLEGFGAADGDDDDFDFDEFLRSTEEMVEVEIEKRTKKASVPSMVSVPSSSPASSSPLPLPSSSTSSYGTYTAAAAAAVAAAGVPATPSSSSCSPSPILVSPTKGSTAAMETSSTPAEGKPATLPSEAVSVANSTDTSARLLVPMASAPLHAEAQQQSSVPSASPTPQNGAAVVSTTPDSASASVSFTNSVSTTTVTSPTSTHGQSDPLSIPYSSTSNAQTADNKADDLNSGLVGSAAVADPASYSRNVHTGVNGGAVHSEPDQVDSAIGGDFSSSKTGVNGEKANNGTSGAPSIHPTDSGLATGSPKNQGVTKMANVGSSASDIVEDPVDSREASSESNTVPDSIVNVHSPGAVGAKVSSSGKEPTGDTNAKSAMVLPGDNSASTSNRAEPAGSDIVANSIALPPPGEKAVLLSDGTKPSDSDAPADSSALPSPGDKRESLTGGGQPTGSDAAANSIPLPTPVEKFASTTDGTEPACSDAVANPDALPPPGEKVASTTGVNQATGSDATAGSSTLLPSPPGLNTGRKSDESKSSPQGLDLIIHNQHLGSYRGPYPQSLHSFTPPPDKYHGNDVAYPASSSFGHGGTYGSALHTSFPRAGFPPGRSSSPFLARNSLDRATESGGDDVHVGVDLSDVLAGGGFTVDASSGVCVVSSEPPKAASEETPSTAGETEENVAKKPSVDDGVDKDDAEGKPASAHGQISSNEVDSHDENLSSTAPPAPKVNEKKATLSSNKPSSKDVKLSSKVSTKSKSKKTKSSPASPKRRAIPLSAGMISRPARPPAGIASGPPPPRLSAGMISAPPRPGLSAGNQKRHQSLMKMAEQPVQKIKLARASKSPSRSPAPTKRAPEIDMPDVGSKGKTLAMSSTQKPDGVVSKLHPSHKIEKVTNAESVSAISGSKATEVLQPKASHEPHVSLPNGKVCTTAKAPTEPLKSPSARASFVTASPEAKETLQRLLLQDDDSDDEDESSKSEETSESSKMSATNNKGASSGSTDKSSGEAAADASEGVGKGESSVSVVPSQEAQADRVLSKSAGISDSASKIEGEAPSAPVRPTATSGRKSRFGPKATPTELATSPASGAITTQTTNAPSPNASPSKKSVTFEATATPGEAKDTAGEQDRDALRSPTAAAASGPVMSAAGVFRFSTPDPSELDRRSPSPPPPLATSNLLSVSTNADAKDVPPSPEPPSPLVKKKGRGFTTTARGKIFEHARDSVSPPSSRRRRRSPSLSWNRGGSKSPLRSDKNPSSASLGGDKERGSTNKRKYSTSRSSSRSPSRSVSPKSRRKKKREKKKVDIDVYDILDRKRRKLTKKSPKENAKRDRKRSRSRSRDRNRSRKRRSNSRSRSGSRSRRRRGSSRSRDHRRYSRSRSRSSSSSHSSRSRSRSPQRRRKSKKSKKLPKRSNERDSRSRSRSGSRSRSRPRRDNRSISSSNARYVPRPPSSETDRSHSTSHAAAPSSPVYPGSDAPSPKNGRRYSSESTGTLSSAMGPSPAAKDATKLTKRAREPFHHPDRAYPKTRSSSATPARSKSPPRNDRGRSSYETGHSISRSVTPGAQEGTFQRPKDRVPRRNSQSKSPARASLSRSASVSSRGRRSPSPALSLASLTSTKSVYDYTWDYFLDDDGNKVKEISGGFLKYYWRIDDEKKENVLYERPTDGSISMFSDAEAKEEHKKSASRERERSASRAKEHGEFAAPAPKRPVAKRPTARRPKPAAQLPSKEAADAAAHSKKRKRPTAKRPSSNTSMARRPTNKAADGAKAVVPMAKRSRQTRLSRSPSVASSVEQGEVPAEGDLDSMLNAVREKVSRDKRHMAKFDYQWGYMKDDDGKRLEIGDDFLTFWFKTGDDPNDDSAAIWSKPTDGTINPIDFRFECDAAKGELEEGEVRSDDEDELMDMTNDNSSLAGASDGRSSPPPVATPRAKKPSPKRRRGEDDEQPPAAAAADAASAAADAASAAEEKQPPVADTPTTASKRQKKALPEGISYSKPPNSTQSAAAASSSFLPTVSALIANLAAAGLPLKQSRPQQQPAMSPTGPPPPMRMASPAMGMQSSPSTMFSPGGTRMPPLPSISTAQPPQSSTSHAGMPQRQPAHPFAGGSPQPLFPNSGLARALSPPMRQNPQFSPQANQQPFPPNQQPPHFGRPLMFPNQPPAPLAGGGAPQPPFGGPPAPMSMNPNTNNPHFASNNPMMNPQVQPPPMGSYPPSSGNKPLMSSYPPPMASATFPPQNAPPPLQHSTMPPASGPSAPPPHQPQHQHQPGGGPGALPPVVLPTQQPGAPTARRPLASNSHHQQPPPARGTPTATSASPHGRSHQPSTPSTSSPAAAAASSPSSAASTDDSRLAVRKWIIRCLSICSNEAEKAIVRKYIAKRSTELGERFHTSTPGEWERMPLPYFKIFESVPGVNLHDISVVLSDAQMATWHRIHGEALPVYHHHAPPTPHAPTSPYAPGAPHAHSTSRSHHRHHDHHRSRTRSRSPIHHHRDRDRDQNRHPSAAHHVSYSSATAASSPRTQRHHHVSYPRTSHSSSRRRSRSPHHAHHGGGGHARDHHAHHHRSSSGTGTDPRTAAHHRHGAVPVAKRPVASSAARGAAEVLMPGGGPAEGLGVGGMSLKSLMGQPGRSSSGITPSANPPAAREVNVSSESKMSELEAELLQGLSESKRLRYANMDPVTKARALDKEYIVRCLKGILHKLGVRTNLFTPICRAANKEVFKNFENKRAAGNFHLGVKDFMVIEGQRVREIVERIIKIHAPPPDGSRKAARDGH